MSGRRRQGICAVCLRIGLVLGSLVLSTSFTHADSTSSSSDVSPAGVMASEPEFSFWIDAAPMTLVIDQLAGLAGKTAEIDELTDMPVSGRFSGSLNSMLSLLSTDYPVAFDVEGEVLRAASSDALTSVSIAMLSTELNDSLRAELMNGKGAGNKLEFREDAVRVSGHPEFVRRTARSITTALVKARGEVLAGVPEGQEADVVAGTPPESGTAEASAIADSGSTEVLADIQDEGRAPADQASLSKPIRWVTDIPGYNTF